MNFQSKGKGKVTSLGSDIADATLEIAVNGASRPSSDPIGLRVRSFRG